MNTQKKLLETARRALPVVHAAMMNDKGAQEIRDALAAAIVAHDEAEAARHQARETIKLAATFLDHPDVAALPFALNSSNIARALRAIVESME